MLSFGLYLFLGIVIAFVIAAYFRFMHPTTKGAPYVPTDDDRLAAMLELAGNVSDKKVIDLGSGDGKVLQAFVAHGVAEAIGYELSPSLVQVARSKFRELKSDQHVEIIWQTFWKADLRDFDIVIMYGMPHLMADIERKIKYEMKTGSLVISNYYTLPAMKPKKTLRNVHLYVI